MLTRSAAFQRLTAHRRAETVAARHRCSGAAPKKLVELGGAAVSGRSSVGRSTHSPWEKHAELVTARTAA